MGGRIAKFFKPYNVRVLILGPDSAGKTTLLYRLKNSRVVTTIPTIGFNVESVLINKTRFTFWDIGGQDKIRTLWKHYFIGVSILIFVVDSADRDRINEAGEILAGVLMDSQMDDCIILVFANKQDLDGAMDSDTVADRLCLRTITSRPWLVKPSCALSGDGLYEGLEWAVTEEKKLTKELKKRANYSKRKRSNPRLEFSDIL